MILYKLSFSEDFEVTTNDQGLFLRLRFQRPLAVWVDTVVSKLIHTINLVHDTRFDKVISFEHDTIGQRSCWASCSVEYWMNKKNCYCGLKAWFEIKKPPKFFGGFFMSGCCPV